jgi:hypothetical protein
MFSSLLQYCRHGFIIPCWCKWFECIHCPSYFGLIGAPSRLFAIAPVSYKCSQVWPSLHSCGYFIPPRSWKMNSKFPPRFPLQSVYRPSGSVIEPTDWPWSSWDSPCQVEPQSPENSPSKRTIWLLWSLYCNRWGQSCMIPGLLF